MNPFHIYFKEMDIDQDQTFTINFTKENEMENVLFDGQNEYGVSRMNIKPMLNNEKIIKIENKKEQKKISEEIQELIKQNKEPNLTFIISHPETNSIEIPFVKKNETELLKKKLIFFNTTTQNNEDFTFYDYVGHPEKIGYEWSKGGFKYKITIKDNKIIKKLNLEKQQRIDFNVDEGRIFNIINANDSFFNILISFSMGYFENITLLKKHFKISGKKFDFTRLPILRKYLYLGEYSTI